jgi:hypothetical protein
VDQGVGLVGGAGVNPHRHAVGQRLARDGPFRDRILERAPDPRFKTRVRGALGAMATTSPSINS